jgi:zinc protease
MGRRMNIGLVFAFLALSGLRAEELKVPAPTRSTLPNGLTILLLEQREVPIISLSVLVKAGTAADPVAKAGLASLTADLLRKGTRTRTAQEQANELDFIGGQLDFTATADYTRGDAEFLAKDITRGLDLLADALLHPVFPAEEVKKLLEQRIDSIKVSKDQPRSVIGSYFSSYLYRDHPYGRPANGDELSLARINRDDVAGFYQHHYAPDNVIIAAVGDFASADLSRLIGARLAQWSGKAAGNVTFPPVEPGRGKRVLVVGKPDSTQTFYRIGNIGIARTNPDRVIIDVVNTLFGGRFTSMLNTELRVNSGLTYGAGSSFVQRKVPGPFLISSFTPNETTEKALDMTLDLLNRLHDLGVTTEQLDSAKNYLKGQFPLDIERTDQLAALLTELEFYGLDVDEVSQYYSRIDAITAEEARRVIKEYFPRENLVFVLVGKPDLLTGLARKYGAQIDTRDIASPGF